MRHHCLEPDELISLLALPADDPRLVAARRCARCDALLQALAVFLAGDPQLAAAEREAAERQMAGTLARLSGQEPAVAVRPPASLASSRRAVAPRAPQRRRAIGLRWGSGLAAAVALVAFFVTREPGLPARPNGTLRGGSPAGPAGPALVVTASAPVAGRVRLIWPAIAGAERYRLELFAADLDTLALLDALTEPAATVAADLLGARDGTPAAGILCRVRAYGSAGELAVSALTGVTPATATP